jgi:hypothetical protein
VLDFTAKFTSRDALDSYIAYRFPVSYVPEERSPFDEVADPAEPGAEIEVLR